VTVALFASLGPRVEGARVLDLFAGTGRLGMEALRCGARSAVFVEREPRSAVSLREALRAAGWGARAEVRRGNALTQVPALAAEGRRFELILLDPPYGEGLQRETIERVAATPLLAEGGVIAAEGHWRDDPGEVDGLERVRVSRYGETAVWFYAGAAKREEGG